VKCVDFEFKPGEGIDVKTVTPLAWFHEQLEQADLTNVVGAVIILVDKNGNVKFLHQEDEKLLVLGALNVARVTLENDYIDVPGDEEEEDEDDDENV